MGDDPAIAALKAAGWGFISAISLVIGAFVGVTCNPKKEIRAALMAFGSGALIEALSIELFAHIVAMSKGNAHRRLSADSASGDDGPGKGLVYVAMAMAILGGGAFAGLNKVLNDAGGFARHASSLKEQVVKKRNVFYQRLANKLKSVPMFAGLGMPELRELASKMKKEVFTEGENVFHHEDLHSPMYFLLSGSVRVDILRAPTEKPQSEAILEKQQTSDVHVVTASEDFYMVEPHQLFGELALITGQPLKANAVAVSDCKVLKLLTHDFIDLVEANPRISQFLAHLAAQSMKNQHLFNEASDESLENLAKETELVCFAADEPVYRCVDETTPMYYLVLGHVWATYENKEDAFASTQDPMKESNKRILRPGKLFGTDHLVKGSDTNVVAIAHDRALVLRLQRADITRIVPRTGSVRAFESEVKEELTMPGSCGAIGDAPPVTIQIDTLVLPESAGVVSKSTESSKERNEKERLLGGGARTRSSTRSTASKDGKDGNFTFGDNLRLAPEITDAEVLEETAGRWSQPGDVDQKAPANHGDGDGGHNNAHAAIMIWLGILIDAVPESVVLGILASTASSGSLLTFVIGVFLANLPEAMSSSGTMAACGISKRRILVMWSSIVGLTGVGAGVGAILFPPGSEETESAQYAIAAIEGCCGGAMLCMIANTALPEAFEQGGNVVGMSTLFGFLAALFVSVTSS